MWQNIHRFSNRPYPWFELLLGQPMCQSFKEKPLKIFEPGMLSLQEEPVQDLDNIASITGLPGYEVNFMCLQIQVAPFLIPPYIHQVLSTNEKRLCTSLRLHPRLYISYKTCLLRDHLSKKKGQIPKPVHPSGLDKLHRYFR